MIVVCAFADTICERAHSLQRRKQLAHIMSIIVQKRGKHISTEKYRTRDCSPLCWQEVAGLLKATVPLRQPHLD